MKTLVLLLTLSFAVSADDTKPGEWVGMYYYCDSAKALFDTVAVPTLTPGCHVLPRPAPVLLQEHLGDVEWVSKQKGPVISHLWRGTSPVVTPIFIMTTEIKGPVRKTGNYWSVTF